MPIYEYQALDPLRGCNKCRQGFETIQGIADKPLRRCPDCNGKIKKLISKCHAAIYEPSQESIRIEKTIHEYEKSEQWGHAAELADNFAHQSKDRNMRERALNNYKKAGYDASTLDRHAKITDD